MNTATSYTPAVGYYPKSKALLSVHQDKVQMPFEIHTLPWMEQNQWQRVNTPYRYNCFQLIWVRQGQGTHLIDLDQVDINDDSIYCITPGQVHLMRTQEKAQGYIISFSLDFVSMIDDCYNLIFNSGLFYAFDRPPKIKVSGEAKEEMIEIIKKMIKEFGNYYLLRSEILRGYLKIFLIYLTRQYKDEFTHTAQSRNVKLVKQFLSLLDKYYASKKMVAEYAQELCITPNYLNAIVKKISGVPASEHIKQRIVLEAKRQASYTNASMKEVAYNLGFSDTAHFSKYFKNASGTTFTDYKNG